MRRYRAVMVTLAAVAGSIASVVAPAGATTPNLIRNPGAEAGTIGTGFNCVNPASWTRTGCASTVKYGAPGGFPTSATPGSPARGKVFFAGGPSGNSQYVQTIPLGAYASLIGTGRAKATLSAWLGGWSSHNDRAAVVVTWRSAGGSTLGSLTIGPVTATQRGNVTKFLFRTATAAVPRAAASAVVTIVFTKALAYNDGYADDLKLTLA